METTRKYPRTLEEAYGPYQRGSLHEPYTPMHKSDKIVLVVCCVSLAGIVVMHFLGWIK